MKIIHNCKTIDADLQRIDCLKPYIQDISLHGEYGVMPKVLPNPSMKEVEYKRTDRFFRTEGYGGEATQASEVIGDRKLTWLKVDKLSKYGVYWGALALWGTDLFMVIGRSNWSLMFHRYDYDFVAGKPTAPAVILPTYPLENVWVPHECAQCGKVDNLVNVHSLVYAGNPQCPDCDESMEPVSGEVEIEDMNARVERMKGGAS